MMQRTTNYSSTVYYNSNRQLRETTQYYQHTVLYKQLQRKVKKNIHHTRLTNTYGDSYNFQMSMTNMTYVLVTNMKCNSYKLRINPEARGI